MPRELRHMDIYLRRFVLYLLTNTEKMCYYKSPSVKITGWGNKFKKVVDKADWLCYYVRVAAKNSNKMMWAILAHKWTALFTNAPWQINSNATLKIPKIFREQNKPNSKIRISQNILAGQTEGLCAEILKHVSARASPAGASLKDLHTKL